MERPLNKHLDDLEIEAILSATEDEAGHEDQLAQGWTEGATSHLDSCKECSRRMQMHRDLQQMFRTLRESRGSAPDSGCNTNIDFTALAAGLLPAVDSERLLAHAAKCERCGAQLNGAVHDLSDEPDSNEEALLATLNSNSLPWRKAMARKISKAAPPVRENKWWNSVFSMRPRLLLVSTVSVATVVLICWISYNPLLPSGQYSKSPETLIAAAYSEHRTFELRILGASNAPIRVERGAGVSNLDKPQALLRAEALISEGLRKNPDDVSFLDTKARADLLDNNYDSAIRSLQRALETESNSASLKTDIATAYFLRAEKTGREGDYHTAFEYLGAVLAAAPNDSVALFNQAIVAERIFLYGAAQADWKKFLQVETDSGWLSEGQHRYELLLQKMNTQGQR